jgi:hypothetical protein
VAGLHQLLLHHVLDLLDVDERLLGGVHPVRDGPGDRDRGGGVALEGEECLADGDLHLLLVPWHHLVVAPDHAQQARRRVAVEGELAGPVEQEALRDKVGVVVDERLLDQLVEGVQPEGELGLVAGEVRQVERELPADAHDPRAVRLGEDLLVAAGQGHVRQRLAQRVGHLGEREALLPVRAEEGDRRQGDVLADEDVAPGVVGFLLDGNVDGALEGEVVR